VALMPGGFLRRGIRATARLAGVSRRKKDSRFAHPDSPERARARLFSPLDPDAVEDDPDLEDKTTTEEDEGDDLAPHVLPPMGAPKVILGIVGSLTRDELGARSDLPSVRDLLPGDELSALEHLEPGTMVLVDRAALFEGPWSAIEAATGTRLMAGLLPLLDAVRSQGGQVVLLDHARPRNVNTNLLVERSDVVLPDTTELDEALGEQPRSALMSVLQKVALRQTDPAAPVEVRP